jgi:hypothetical protein
MGEQTTCSSIISFAQKLQEKSSEFYRELPKKYQKNQERFLAFSSESKKIEVLVTRTYQETISDALEACFIQINLDDYQTETKLTEDLSYSDALKKAIDLEDEAVRFYTEAAERSKALLATITSAFRTAAKRRNKQKLELESILENLER